MPVYLYRRQDGTTFEYRQKFSDDALATCPTTGQGVHRIPQASGIIFKGSGFYVNDNKAATKPSPVAENSKAEAKSDRPAADASGNTAAKESSATSSEPKTQSKSDAAD